MHSRRGLAAAALAAVLPLAACGAESPSGEVPGGAVGPDAEVSADVEVLQVHLAYPADGVYEEGEDATLLVAISNDGTTTDELVDVTGPGFARAELVTDESSGSIPVPEDDNVYVGAEGPPSIVLEDLARSLRSSQSIPVTFVFEEAGEVTVDAMVAAAGQEPFTDPAEDVTPDT
jgi:periplasmic copper chaperone A